MGIDFYRAYFKSDALNTKLSIVFVPQMVNTIVEYPGSLLLRDDYIFQANNYVDFHRFNRDRLILRGLGKLWFGNSVTLEWWNDLWISNSLSIFFSYYALNQLKFRLRYVNFDMWIEFSREKMESYDSERTSILYSLSSPVETTDDIDTINLMHNGFKGASIFNMVFETIDHEEF